MRLEPFEPARHDPASFRCGNEQMDTWIRRFARRSQRDALTRVFVLVEPLTDGKQPIIGYFALSMCSVAVESLAPEDQRRLPRYPVPAVLLTRLAVTSAAQGRGLGGALLYKAAGKALLANEVVAARLFVVDAIDERAAAFYRGFGFTSAPGDPLRLYIGLERLGRGLS